MSQLSIVDLSLGIVPPLLLSSGSFTPLYDASLGDANDLILPYEKIPTLVPVTVGRWLSMPCRGIPLACNPMSGQDLPNGTIPLPTGLRNIPWSSLAPRWSLGVEKSWPIYGPNGKHTKKSGRWSPQAWNLGTILQAVQDCPDCPGCTICSVKRVIPPTSPGMDPRMVAKYRGGQQ